MPTPRGGRWGVMLALLPFWVWALWKAGRLIQPLELAFCSSGAVLLMAISWIDDRRGLGPAVRFAAQILAVGAVMALLPADLSLSAGLLPLPLDRLVAGFIWLWFVNLFNFMDGIDGIAGGSAAAMGFGLMLIWLRHGPDQLEAFRGAMFIPVALGFLIWNWSPAKIFMGDVGSVPLGYLLGFCPDPAGWQWTAVRDRGADRRHVLPGRRHPHLAQACQTGRQDMAGASRAFLPAFDPARPQPWPHRENRDPRAVRAGDLRLAVDTLGLVDDLSRDRHHCPAVALDGEPAAGQNCITKGGTG